MRKLGRKLRDIKFFSRKNNELIIVHSEDELRYAKKLEEDGSVISYIYGKALDKVNLNKVMKVDIRGSYFKDDWYTDFYVIAPDGSVSIREICSERDLDKLAEVEKLELSRRYWKFIGVADWKIVMR